MPNYPCPECGDPMPEGVDCHHHNEVEDTDYGGRTIAHCEDCPSWRVVERED